MKPSTAARRCLLAFGCWLFLSSVSAATVSMEFNTNDFTVTASKIKLKPGASFVGEASGLTNANASALSSGTVSDARLNPTVSTNHGTLTAVPLAGDGGRGVTAATAAQLGTAISEAEFSGIGISNLNASSLGTGTAPPARLATNSATANDVLTATSAQTARWSAPIFGVTSNDWSGSFTGNGAGLTNLSIGSTWRGISNSAVGGTNFIVDNLKTTINAGSQNTLVVTNGRVGVGTTGPLNKLDVAGGVVIGSAFAGSVTAPAEGLAVQGNQTNSGAFSSGGSITSSGGIIANGSGAFNTPAQNINGYTMISRFALTGGTGEGRIRFTDYNTGSTFDRLEFGGGTAAYPSIKRSNGDLKLSDGDGTGTTNSFYVPGGIIATNFFALATNYVAANFVPIPGLVKFCASNQTIYAVSDVSTNALW